MTRKERGEELKSSGQKKLRDLEDVHIQTSIPTVCCLTVPVSLILMHFPFLGVALAFHVE